MHQWTIRFNTVHLVHYGALIQYASCAQQCSVVYQVCVYFSALLCTKCSSVHTIHFSLLEKSCAVKQLHFDYSVQSEIDRAVQMVVKPVAMQFIANQYMVWCSSVLQAAWWIVQCGVLHCALYSVVHCTLYSVVQYYSVVWCIAHCAMHSVVALWTPRDQPSLSLSS